MAEFQERIEKIDKDKENKKDRETNSIRKGKSLGT
jgi:hypothetical protein